MIWKIDDGWTLFLDRDGVINERIFGGYVTDKSQFVLREDFLTAIPLLSELFERIIVVTNQQGIGKGIMTDRNLLDIHDFMLSEVSHVGGRIDKVYYASNLKGEHPDRRKPHSNMAIEAQKDFNEIDFKKSVMIGDTDSDILFGKNLGMRTVLLRSEEVTKECAELEIDNLNELLEVLK